MQEPVKKLVLIEVDADIISKEKMQQLMSIIDELLTNGVDLKITYLPFGNN